MVLKNLLRKAAPYFLAGAMTIFSGLQSLYGQNPKQSENSRLVIYGNNHWYKNHRQFMINSIDSLKRRRYNTLAVELHVNFDSSMQNYFSSNKEYRDSIIDNILNNSLFGNLLEMPYNFYKKGFKIVPIDEGETAFSENNERDFYIAKNIEEILEKDSTTKIIAFVGSYHANEIQEPLIESVGKYIHKPKYPPMAGILKNKGIDPKTILLMNGRKLSKEEFQEIQNHKELYDEIIYLK